MHDNFLGPESREGCGKEGGCGVGRQGNSELMVIVRQVGRGKNDLLNDHRCGREFMMAITFGENQYGKAEVRLVHVTRDGDRHQIKDLNVSTALRGDFAARAPGR